MRRALVVAEVALTMVIAGGAGLFLQSLHRLTHVNPASTPATSSPSISRSRESRYQTAAQQHQLCSTVLDRLAGLPGVRAVAATNLVPHGSASSGINISIEGRPAPPPGKNRTPVIEA